LDPLLAPARVTREPPFDNERLPWHADLKVDQQDLQSGMPTKLDWALFPFSNYLRKDHRLRITINSFDKNAFLSPEISPPPTVHTYHEAQHPSSITLPFIAR
jgi:predicted acyl esterase